MKLRIRYGDGVFRGGLLDLRKYTTSRRWWGRPQPGCIEFLLDISRSDEQTYPGCFFLVRISHVRDAEGEPDSPDYFDYNSHAIVLSPTGVMIWFQSQAMEPPPEAVEMARKHKGEFPGVADDDPPPPKTMTRSQQEVWDALSKGPADATKLSKMILNRNSPDAMQRIEVMRRDGWKIYHDTRVGYYRADVTDLPEDAANVST